MNGGPVSLPLDGEQQKAQARRDAAAKEVRKVLLERQVLHLAACGYTEQEISSELARGVGKSGLILGEVTPTEVRKVLRKAKEEAAREVASAGAEALKDDLLTLKELKRSLAPKALGGSLGAVKELREVLSLRSKLLGTLVERHEIAPLTPVQVERLKRALRDPALSEEEREKLKADLTSGEPTRVSAALVRLGVLG